MATNIILSKESSADEIQAYFNAVFQLSQSDNEFPINLDEVCPLVYTQKQHAMRDLKKNFIDGIDFNLSKNGQVIAVDDLRSGVEYQCFLSLPCMEFFIARKVRPVFDVYRKVFHRVATMHLPTVLPQPDRKKRLDDLMNLSAISRKVGIGDAFVKPLIDDISRCIESVKELEETVDRMRKNNASEYVMRCVVVSFLGRYGVCIDDNDESAKAIDRFNNRFYNLNTRLQKVEDDIHDIIHDKW